MFNKIAQVTLFLSQFIHHVFYEKKEEGKKKRNQINKQ